MAKMQHERAGRRHPLLAEAAQELHDHKLSRRDFLRIAALLGVAAPSVSAWAKAENTAQTQAKFGGILRCAMQVRGVADPAHAEWMDAANQLRHQYENLTITGPDNITRPMLAERWAASDDLTTWTFFLRPNVTWRSGDPFTADDVLFNFNRWLAPGAQSPNKALLPGLCERVDGALKPIDGAVEKVDALTVRLHLNKPALSVPENLYQYTTALVHPSFTGDAISDANGTGPYQLIESIPGRRAVCRRVQIEGWRYWGADVPHIGPGYLDEIHYEHFEPGATAALQAVIEGRADMNYEISPADSSIAHETPQAAVWTAETTQTGCIRMRQDAPPFTDIRVRQAVQLCCDPTAYPGALFEGAGRPAEHHHVARLHADYFPLPPIRRNIERARVLLADAGYPNGLDLTLHVGNTSSDWQQKACELLRDQAAPAGIRIKVEVVSAARYAEIWRTTPFGLTQWTHRPLGTMALSLAYRSDAWWNETGYANPKFDAALDAAEATLDLGARREAMQSVQRILQQDAVMAQPVWLPISFLAKDYVKGLAAHPAQAHQFNAVWLDKPDAGAPEIVDAAP